MRWSSPAVLASIVAAVWYPAASPADASVIVTGKPGRPPAVGDPQRQRRAARLSGDVERLRSSPWPRNGRATSGTAYSRPERRSSVMAAEKPLPASSTSVDLPVTISLSPLISRIDLLSELFVYPVVNVNGRDRCGGSGCGGSADAGGTDDS
jgi:hypothetical protein